MGGVISPVPPGMALQATTGPAGFALQNATPTILSWTAPNDGQLHRFLIIPAMTVTSALTGGQISLSFMDPGGNPYTPPIYAANSGLGRASPLAADLSSLIKAGTTVQVNQSTAVNPGAATLWAELWGG